MCVAISMEPGTKLELDEVVRMGMANGDGVGFAWAEDGVVKWYKTVVYNPEYIERHINDRKDFFRLVHFRLSTVGGARADLCHPFEVGPLANADPAGSSSQVLVHNGHWFRWTDIFEILKKEGILPDTGPWSDSRLAALLAAYDLDWIDAVTGKVAIMNGNGDTKFWGSWDVLRPGIKVSNTHWKSHTYNFKRSGKDRQWMGWGWSEDNWRARDQYEKDQKANAAKEAAAAAKESKETNGKAKVETEKEAGSIRVAVQSPDTDVRLTQAAEKRADGRRDSGRREQGNGHETLGKEGQAVQGKVGRYDAAPWYNKTNDKWYRVDPTNAHARNAGVTEISEAHARKLLAEIAAAAGKAEPSGKT